LRRSPHASHRLAPSGSASAGMEQWTWLVGDWTCTKAGPAVDLPGYPPKSTHVIITRAGAGDAIAFTMTGRHFSALQYISYDAKTRTFVNPQISADGSYGYESTRDQTSARSVWAGVTTDSRSGRPSRMRDTYVRTGNDELLDYSEYWSPKGAGYANQFTCLRNQ
jgi:hypothetical protein